MPRQARGLIQDQVYHVITRGNNREFIFKEQDDFEKFVEILSRYKDRDKFLLYHWVLMTNHVHLIIHPGPGISLSKTMQGINLAFTRWYNKKYSRVGHLWQDRFKSHLIEQDAYLLECGRYVERNPLRVGLVADPHDYQWTSYRAYAHDDADGLTDIQPLYAGFGRNEAQRKKAYRDYVLSYRDREEQEMREKMIGGILGGPGFVEAMESRILGSNRPKRGRPRKNDL